MNANTIWLKTCYNFSIQMRTTFLPRKNLQSLKLALTQGGESAVTRQGRGDHRRWTWDR